MYSTAEAAALSLEAIDVRGNIYSAYDCTGRVLRLHVQKDGAGWETIGICDTDATHPQVLADAIENSLDYYDKKGDLGEAVTLESMVRYCIRSRLLQYTWDK